MRRARKAKRISPATVASGHPNSRHETVDVPVLAPRNPLVAPAHRLKAGAHGGGARRRRREEKRELRRLLDE
jgi:hypothetical protein